MRVDHLDDGHGAEQEKSDARGRRDGLIKLVSETSRVTHRERIDGPEQSGTE